MQDVQIKLISPASVTLNVRIDLRGGESNLFLKAPIGQACIIERDSAIVAAREILKLLGAS